MESDNHDSLLTFQVQFFSLHKMKIYDAYKI